MSTNTSCQSRKERILFELLCTTNELQEIKNSLTILEVDDIEHALKKLQFVIRDNQQSKRQLFECRV